MTNPWLDQVSTKHTVTKFVLIGWVAILIVATQQWAFVIDPKQYSDSTMKFAMYLYWVGWLLLVLGTQVVAIRSLWDQDPTWKQILILGATRPLSILLIHYQLHAQTGDWFFGYLSSNPIFIVSDIAIPGVLLYLAWRERDNEMLLIQNAVREDNPVSVAPR